MRSVITSSRCVSGWGSKGWKGRTHTSVAASTWNAVSHVMSLTNVPKKKLSLKSIKWDSKGWCYPLYSNNFKRNGLCFQFLHFWVPVVTAVCSTDPLKFMLPLPDPSFLSPWVYRPLSSVYWLRISQPKQSEHSFLIRIDSLVSCTMLLSYGLMWKSWTWLIFVQFVKC